MEQATAMFDLIFKMWRMESLRVLFVMCKRGRPPHVQAMCVMFMESVQLFHTVPYASTHLAQHAARQSKLIIGFRMLGGDLAPPVFWAGRARLLAGCHGERAGAKGGATGGSMAARRLHGGPQLEARAR